MSAPTLPELIKRIRESGGSLTIELALTEIDRRLTALERPRVGAWVRDGAHLFAFDGHGKEIAAVWPVEGKGWAWMARRAFLPRARDERFCESEADALAAADAVIATWADRRGE